MQEVTLSVPNDSLLALNTTLDEIGGELKIMAAMKLYELKRLSSGAAARLAGIPKPLFLTKLADYGINTFSLTSEELEEEFAVVDTYL